MNTLLIISGPTASGKTSLGFQIAKKFNGEIVSSDSRQVYRGMDIVTGKEVNKEIKTWLIDIVNPDQSFNVADYYQQAWTVISDIWKRGKLPIVVGGTGFYIKALLDGIGTMGIEPDWELRRELEVLPVDQLQQRLQEASLNRWERMNESDRRNPRRLVRAIEIVRKSDSGQARMTSFWGGAKATTPESTLWIGLKTDLKALYRRIDQRVDERIKQGALEETKKLATKYGWDIPSMTGQGYRELKGFIEGKIPLDEAVQRWKFAEHEYARKQMTWFKKEKRITAVDIGKAHFIETVQGQVQQWYT